MKTFIAGIMILAMVAMSLAGCSMGLPGSTEESASPAEAPDAGFGALQVRITDAPKYGVESVVVHFSEVSVHKAGEGEEPEEENPSPTPTGTTIPTPSATPIPSSTTEGGWIDIPVEGGSFDLVELGKEGIEALLAQDDQVPAGKYTQIRVIIDEEDPVTVTYTDPVNLDDEGNPELITVDATLPSGELKFVHPFEVVDGTTTIITLDFVVEDSVVFTGSAKSEQGVKVILKPVVKLSVEQETLAGTIAGTVTDSTTDDPIEGATIAIEGTELTATTGADGKYAIAGIPVGTGTATYKVLASAQGYDSASKEDVTVNADTTSSVNFQLNPKAGP